MKSLIILSAFVFSFPTFSEVKYENKVYKSFHLPINHPHPFEKPQTLKIPEKYDDAMKESHILFIGESHVGSFYLREKKSQEKMNAREINSSGRKNSYDQETSYFNLVRRFSELHPSEKKCLWLEYLDLHPSVLSRLKGLSEGHSHYFLTDSARKRGWSIFAVDKTFDSDSNLGHLSKQDRNEYVKKTKHKTRDEHMASNIAETIESGECEKGIAVNGAAHLSGYPYAHVIQKDGLDVMVKKLFPEKIITVFVLKESSEIQ